MKNFKAASALQRKLICESLCSLCCPESFWGEEEEPVPCSYCQVYHMWVSQDINIPRQLKALEQAVFRWSPLVWASLGQFGRKAVCLPSPQGPSRSRFPIPNGILWPWISQDKATQALSWRSLLFSLSPNNLVSSYYHLISGSQLIQNPSLIWKWVRKDNKIQFPGTFKLQSKRHLNSKSLLLALWSWTHYLNSLSLRHLTCNLDKITSHLKTSSVSVDLIRLWI